LPAQTPRPRSTNGKRNWQPRPASVLAALNAEIHGLCADGTLMRGIGVLHATYEAMGLGWVLRPVVDRAYRLFARHRQTISRASAPLIHTLRRHRARQLAKRMAACHGGQCTHPPHTD
jgi:hypothetical protein